MRKAATVLLGVVFLLAGVAGCRGEAGRSAPERNGRATIAVTAWPASASLFIAHEKGYFQDEGIEATLELNESGHLGLDAVLSGKADFATAGDTPIARAAVDGKPLAVIATVGETTRVTPGAVDLLGFSPQEQGTSLREQLAMLRLETEDGRLLPPEDAPPLRALRGETVRGVVALILRLSDGKPLRVSISAAPIRTLAGRLQGAVAVFTDIGSLHEKK